MTTTTTPLLDQALDLVRKLPPSDRAELVARVVRDLATTVPSPVQPRMTPAEARAALADIRTAIGALPQPRRTLAEQLDADRRDRDQSLMGFRSHEARDVHP